jgi:MYXO-CTERM domain-containing protein
MLVSAGTLSLLTSSTADAHFHVQTPTPWVIENDGAGDPQKAAPCGVDSTVTYTPSNVVTSYAPGQVVHIVWNETVQHSGWYRISLAADRADLKDPAYSTVPSLLGPVADDAAISNPPVAPVLVDGLFPHQIGDAPPMYSYDLTLPDTPCEKCTLQIIEFMSNHTYNVPGGYFYHHCMDISIRAGADGGVMVVSDAGTVKGRPASMSATSTGSDATTGSSAGSGTTGDDAGDSETEPSSDDAGTPNSPGSNGGCSTASGADAPTVLGVATLAGLALVAMRRRRRANA